jgi:hypothetical protein
VSPKGQGTTRATTVDELLKQLDESKHAVLVRDLQIEILTDRLSGRWWQAPYYQDICKERGIEPNELNGLI